MPTERIEDPAARRSVIYAAAGLMVLAVVGAFVVGILGSSDAPPPSDQPTQAELDGAVPTSAPAVVDKPSSLPLPNSGRKPADAGDPGGWEQLTLFGLMMAAMVGIAGGAFFTARKVKGRRTAWQAAAEPGQEEARWDRVDPDHRHHHPVSR